MTIERPATAPTPPAPRSAHARRLRDVSALKQHVMMLGGAGKGFELDEHIAYGVPRAFEALLLAHATRHGAPDVVLKREPARACHQNAARYASTHGAVMWSGFSLSERGIWWMHSWCMKAGKLIECTPVARVAYVGVAIDSVERMDAFSVDK